MKRIRWTRRIFAVAASLVVSGHSLWADGAPLAADTVEFGEVRLDEPKEWKPETRFAVAIAHGVRCPVMRQNYPAFARLVGEYEKRGVMFYFVNGVPQDTVAEIEAERMRYKAPPILRDENQEVLRALGLKTVGETVLLEKQDGKWRARYRGGISDRVNFDRALTKAPHEYLKDAIEDRLAGREVRTRRGSVFGCSITFR